MNRKTLAAIIVIGALSLAGAVLPRALAKAGHGMDHSMHMGAMNMKPAVKADVLSLESIHSKHVPMVLMSIEKARKAVEAGDKKAALAELDKAKNMLVAIHAALGTHVKPKFANSLCPIMGSPIDPAKVTPDLTRKYKGQTVAFCCAGCPTKWDQLTDAQKDAKLANAKPTLQQVWTCPMHPQVKTSGPGMCPVCNMKLVPARGQ